MTASLRGNFAPSTVSAHIAVRGAEAAAAWYERAFGAELGRRIAVPDGRFMEIEVRLGDSVVSICDEFPEMGVVSPLSLGGTYGALHIATTDASTVWSQALAAGAEVHQELADTFWGERHGQIIDPFGHRWGISQRLRDVSDEEMAAAVAKAFGSPTA
ncbi:MAG: VOC family protein [Candidatus Dormibacteraeota bacterium]|nr:VOC family protein [Candidatus Dormibacteraeota bacterium]